MLGLRGKVKSYANYQGWGGGVCAVTGAANASGERQGRPKLRQLVQESWCNTWWVSSEEVKNYGDVRILETSKNVANAECQGHVILLLQDKFLRLNLLALL